jgi:hypothetical protein
MVTPRSRSSVIRCEDRRNNCHYSCSSFRGYGVTNPTRACIRFVCKKLWQGWCDDEGQHVCWIGLYTLQPAAAFLGTGPYSSSFVCHSLRQTCSYQLEYVFAIPWSCYISFARWHKCGWLWAKTRWLAITSNSNLASFSLLFCRPRPSTRGLLGRICYRRIYCCCQLDLNCM